MSARLIDRIITNAVSTLITDQLAAGGEGRRRGQRGRPSGVTSAVNVDGFSDDDVDDAASARTGRTDLASDDVPPNDAMRNYTSHGSRAALEAAARQVLVSGFVLKREGQDDDWQGAIRSALTTKHADTTAFVEAMGRTAAIAATTPCLAGPHRLATGALYSAVEHVEDTALLPARDLDHHNAAAVDAIVSTVSRMPLSHGYLDDLLALCEDASWLAVICNITLPRDGSRSTNPEENLAEAAKEFELPTKEVASVASIVDAAWALQFPAVGRNAAQAAAFVLSKCAQAAMSTPAAGDEIQLTILLLLCARALASSAPDSPEHHALHKAFNEGVIAGILKGLAANETRLSNAAVVEPTRTELVHQGRFTLAAVDKLDKKKKKKSSTTAAPATAPTAAGAAPAAAPAASPAPTTDTAAAPATGDAAGATPAAPAAAPVDADTAAAIAEAQRDLDAMSDSTDSDDERPIQTAAATETAAQRERRLRRQAKKNKDKEPETPPQWRVPLHVGPFGARVVVTVEECSERKLRITSTDRTAATGLSVTPLATGDTTTIALQPTTVTGGSHVVLISGSAAKAVVGYRVACDVSIGSATASVVTAGRIFAAAVFGMRIGAGVATVPFRSLPELTLSIKVATGDAAATPPPPAAAPAAPTEATADADAASIALAPLLVGGLRSAAAAPVDADSISAKLLRDDATMASQLKLFFGRAMIIHEAPRVCSRHILAVLAKHFPLSDAVSVLARRWMAWGVQLQGEVNAPMRQRLTEVCTWLVNRVAVRSDAEAFSCIAALDHIQAILVSNVPLPDLEKTLTTRTKAAAVLPPLVKALGDFLWKPSGWPVRVRVATSILKATEHGSIDAIADGVVADTAAEVIAALHGVIADLCNEARACLTADDVHCATIASASRVPIRVDAVVATILAARRSTSALQKLIDRALLSPVMENAARFINASLTDTVGSDATGPQAVLRDIAASTRLADDPHFTSNQAGVTITKSANQGIIVDRPASGVHSLRSSIPIASTYAVGRPGVSYFEATISAGHDNAVKRVAVGVADPLADVSSFRTVNNASAKYRVIAMDSSFLSENHFCVPFGNKDVIGVGVDIAAGQVFFTLNGHVVLRRTLEADDSTTAKHGDIVAGSALNKQQIAVPPTFVPFVVYETTERSSLVFNTGLAPFACDFRDASLAATKSSRGDDPNATSLVWAWDASLRAAVGVARASLAAPPSETRAGAVQLFSDGLSAFVGRAATCDGDDPLAMRAAVALATLGEELLHSAGSAAKGIAPVDAPTLCQKLTAVSKATSGASKPVFTSVLAKLVGAFRAVANDQSDALLSVSTPLALPPNSSSKTLSLVPYVAHWEQTKDDAVDVNGSVACLKKKSPLGHVLGSPLPTTGITTFSVLIQSRTPNIGSVLGFGQFYIGVSCATPSDLSGLSWKGAEPPVVWALHSQTQSQLGHANMASCGIDPFVFSSGTVLTVAVDRDRGTVSFSRGGRTYVDVFEKVPGNVELRPFVQIVGENCSATLVAGTRASSVTPDLLSRRDATRVLRSLFTLPNGAASVAKLVQEDLTAPAPVDDVTDMAARRHSRALQILGAIGDPSAMQYQWASGASSASILRVHRDRCLIEVASGGDRVAIVVPSSQLLRARKFVPLDALLLPAAKADAATADDVDPFGSDSDADGAAVTALATADGLQKCVDSAATLVSSWCDKVIRVAALIQAEDRARCTITTLQDAGFQQLTNAIRMASFTSLVARNTAMPAAVLQAPTPARAPTFSARHSTAALTFPAHYSGHLMITPEQGFGPWVGIANEAIPATGVTNIRILVESDWRGLMPTFIAHGFRSNGGFIGLCTDAYHGALRKHAKRTDAAVDMWAIPFVDNPSNHMPHCKQVARNFRLINSKDIVRLHINRTRRTMELFVGDARGASEVCLGVMYGDLPVGVPLYPFVELPTTNASAIFLPDVTPMTRPIENVARYAHLLGESTRNNRPLCIGCANELSENLLETPLWYRCNSCADIDLCVNCFNAHLHCGHTFSQLSPSSYVASPLECGVKEKGAMVEIAASPVVLLSVDGCTADRESMFTRASFVAESGAGFASWGLLRKSTDTNALEVDCTLLWEVSGLCDVVIGIGKADSVRSLTTADQFVAAAAAGTDGILAASAVTPLVPAGSLLHPTRCGGSVFKPGDIVSFILAADTVEFAVNSTPLWRVRRAVWAGQPLAVFVACTRSASLVAQWTPVGSRAFVTGKISDVNSAGEIRVGMNGAYRWLPASAARRPLIACRTAHQLKPGVAVFIIDVVNNDLVPATVQAINTDQDLPVLVSDGKKTTRCAYASVFLSEADVKSAEAHNDAEAAIDVVVLHKRRLRRFYSKYAPTKTDAEIDKAVTAYMKAQGGLESMWKALITKYGPEPQEEVSFIPDARYLRRIAPKADVDSREAFRAMRLMGLLSEYSNPTGIVSAAGHAKALTPALAQLAVSVPPAQLSADGGDAQTLLSLLDRADQVSSLTLASGKRTAAPPPPAQLPAPEFWEMVRAAGALPVANRGPAVALSQAEWSAAGAWRGELVTVGGFAMPMCIDFALGTAQVTVAGAIRRDAPDEGPVDTPLNLIIAQRSINAPLGLVTVVLGFADAPSEARHALVARISDVGGSIIGSAKNRRPCPALAPGLHEPPFMQLTLRVAGDDQCGVEWATPASTRGTGRLTLRGAETAAMEASDAFRPLPAIDGNHSTKLTVSSAEAPASAVTSSQQLLYRLGLDLHVSLLGVPDAQVPRPADLLAELTALYTLHGAPAISRITKIAQTVAARSPETWSAVVLLAIGVANAASTDDTASAKTSCRASSAVLVATLALEQAADASRFWSAFAAVVRVAHTQPTSNAAMKAVKTFAQRCPKDAVTNALVTRLTSFLEDQFSSGSRTRAMCTACDVLCEVLPKSADETALPLKHLAFLIDAARAMEHGTALPACADVDAGATSAAAASWVPAGTGDRRPGELRGDRLYRGQVRSTRGFSVDSTGRPVYFEVVLPAAARVVVGWGVAYHGDTSNALGEDEYAIGFDGTSLLHAGNCNKHGWAAAAGGRLALGCTLDPVAGTVRFSVNGEQFNPVKLPDAWKSQPLFAYAQASRTSGGAHVCSTKQACRFVPPQTDTIASEPLSAADAYDSAARSAVPPAGAAIYTAIAHHLADPSKNAAPSDLTSAQLASYIAHVKTIEQTILRCWSLVDPTDSESRAGAALGLLKRVVTKAFRDEHLCVIPPIETKKNRRALPQIVVRWFDLFSKRPRTVTEALQRSVLGQLHRQFGANAAMLHHTPMFMTTLMMTDSGHTPIDAGGPYNQVWSLLSEEVMTDAGQKPDFHRNPLFRFIRNAKGTFVVPDPKLRSAFELSHFQLLGAIMGHMVRAKTVLAFEISPFVWKFLVGDKLAVKDYLDDVESFPAQLLESDDALASADVETYFPGFSRHLEHLSLVGAAVDPAELRRQAAERSLVHSMDAQLTAMREGLWSTLGARCVKAMTWRDLELRVCGLPYPTFEQFQASIKCALPAPQAQMFWDAVKAFTPQEWGDFFYFAAAQKRYPLTRKITVQLSGNSPDHMPVASTCFATVSMPAYRSAEEFGKKIRQCIACHDMELA